LTENAGRENDGPSKLQGGAEFAGPENVGPQKTMTGNCNTWKMMDQIAALEFARPGK